MKSCLVINSWFKMVNLTAVLCRIPKMNKKCPKPEIWIRRQPLYRISSIFKGRRRNCFTVARPWVERALLFSAWGRHMKPKYSRMLRISRLEGALMPFGVAYEGFMENLAKLNVLLNRKVLADFSIWEPRTFQSLVSLSDRKADLDGEIPLNEKPLRQVTDNVLGKTYLQ